MTTIFNKKEITDDEYIYKYALIYLGMKRIKDEQLKKITDHDDNRSAMNDFMGKSNFLFVNQINAEMVLFSTQAPEMTKVTRKALIVIKARQDTREPGFPNGVQNEIVFMEMNKPVLDNLHNVCSEVFLPILSNPLNQVNLSDLVSKDLMEKFHQFLAYTYVTIGQVKGSTLLPLPQADVTSSERTSSKDKAHILETAIIHWQKQIKNVLKQDPENNLKGKNHPLPRAEINFWKNKSENLNSICKQLSSERIKKVLKFLEQNKSTYTTPFSKLQKEVQIAQNEANENYKYLQTLSDMFAGLDDGSKELYEVSELFVPIMHTILLIWNHSQNYNTPARLVVLIRQICNAIIRQCRSNIDGQKIFECIKNEEAFEAHQKLGQALEVCTKFKDAYFEYKSRSKNQWKVSTNALFVRLDAFSERCQDILHLTGAISQFHKLQKIEIGNTRGKTMTANIMTVFNEFSKAVEDFMLINYDILDIEQKEFDDDFFVFRQRVKEQERRLSAILTQSFDDCDTIIGKFKLLDSFEGLLNRPIILDELERKQITLLELFKQDLKTTQNIFQEGKVLVDRVDERSPISSNMPPIAGALNWTRGLFDRVHEPMERLNSLPSVIQEREEFKDVQKLYNSLCKSLQEFEQAKIADWVQGVEDNTEVHLNKFLLVREETDIAPEGFMRVNFDPVLVRLLREVKYLKLIDIEVPPRAAELFAKVNVYRTQTNNLDLTVNMYNDVLSTLLPVEKPLLQDRIQMMLEALQPGIATLMWNSENINPFINKAIKIVSEVDELVKKMKENVRKMNEIMEKWTKPLYERKNKALLAEDVEQTHQALVQPRLEDVRNNGKEIHRLMKDTQDNIKPDKKSHQWLSYLDYINGLVIEGITNGINGSMLYLKENLSIQYNKVNQLQPIFDIKVNLQDRKVMFDPTIGSNERDNGIRDIINKIVADFISLAIMMPGRIDASQNQQATSNNGDYLVEIKDQFQLFSSINQITKGMNEIEDATKAFIHQYDDKKFLWEERLEVSFQEFLNSGASFEEIFRKELDATRTGADDEDQKIEEEMDAFKWMTVKILDGVVTRFPQLDVFDEKIAHLTVIKKQISEMKQSVDIGWLRVNSLPLIRELEKTIDDWIQTHTSFLLNNTTQQIKNIQKFIADVSEGTKVVPKSNETEQEKAMLMSVMTHLRDVKMIRQKTLDQIDPMKQAIMLMKKHQVKMEEDFLVTLETIKTNLKEVSEKALGPVKESILPLQNQEAQNIKGRLARFGVIVQEFRIKFENTVPKMWNQTSPEIINQAYELISQFYDETCKLEEEAKELNNLETLFDLQRSTYKQLKDCKQELIQLKDMWDLIALIDMQFDSWKRTLWDQINTENLTQLIKDMQQKQCNPTNPHNKVIGKWRAFSSLNERVKNMNTVLPLISLLHSEFMQDRHWKKLMHVTEKHIDHASPKFCFEDLLQLHLYKFADEVTEIVDGAQKESKIETKVNVISRTWDDCNFTFVEKDDCYELGALDLIIEQVETQSMELMGMLAQKEVEEFKENVSKWQKTLKTVDAVVEIWVKVQKNWSRLNPIFLASEDIRGQLPDDTKRFEKVDIEFKDLMRDAVENPGVIEACTFEGREELLVGFNADIETCEKALNAYLEDKKKVFPRFYFLSNQSLLDILSNGNNPVKVDEQIGNCFDGLRNLNFIKEGPEPYKTAQGMYSKDNDEYVQFITPFTCTGAVESYLCDLEVKMQSTLKEILDMAKEATEEWDISKPRHEWLDQYCAQISLLATQIVWTEETQRAFEELENGGSESAMKDYYNLTVNRISLLIQRVRSHLTHELRVKIITIITIDVHERDVIEKFVTQKIVDSGHFAWSSQLKFYMESKPKEPRKVCQARICDWNTWYNYEYVGNCGRLVITPLTDRCYITLTQALNLSMGGAPAGPAGTGKTETTKDLGRALGLQVVVFNCSDQMNYQSMGQIFMGLSQSGSWGCFDEFNRISIEVLSVVSTQVKTCLDAIRDMKANPAKNMFQFEDQGEIQLRITCGFWITMNPGYAGRTELPENLKALFRSCAMVVPNIVLICENMLMSEGFETARDLSKKFMCLYNLAKSLLSEQVHYDWGLRAVKSVLRQAGKLKRADPNISEEELLMRALRDFNWPKIKVEDRSIFMGLIFDLFPGINPDQLLDEELESICGEVAKAKNLQPEKEFVLKCIQFADILEVRHSCFLIGVPGTAKSAVWKNLCDALTKRNHPTAWDIVDPKAVTSDELYGCMNTKTKEWKDGVLSVIMRDMNKSQGKYKTSHKYKWVILDGDVDPEWIESLNTVMDDNKVLTLVSQERIPLTPEMRLVLEVSNLRNATPATVSRGGVLYINDSDIGWRPYVDTWLNRFKAKGDEIANNSFTLFISHYCNEGFLSDLKSKETAAPICEIQMITSLTTIIDYLYDDLYVNRETSEYLKKLKEEGQTQFEDALKIIYEGFFVFGMTWAFGGAFVDARISFNGVLRAMASRVKFPDGGLVYDYFFNVIQGGWTLWSERVQPYDVNYGGLFNNLVVPSAETTRQKFLIDVHRKTRKGLLYVGFAGTGKTTIIKDYFSMVNKELTVTASMNMNSYTDSKALQIVIESNVDKRMGKIFGPPTGKILMFFMDDLNMPKLDKYGTQSPICLIRQIIDYQLVFDRDHLEEKKTIQDVMFLGCLNPKSGSFIIDLRLSRHFTLIALGTPEKEILNTIYHQIYENHLSQFDNSFKGYAKRVVDATTTVFMGIALSAQFMPTARKFHYQFNLRDFSRIIQNLLNLDRDAYTRNPLGLARMWAHECYRVYLDRLITPEDVTKFNEFMLAGMKEFSDFKPDMIMAEPNIYTKFISLARGHAPAYLPIKDMDELKQILEQKLEQYNENVATMDLVLFSIACEHITRIARIVDEPCGNALLVGVGGSGKQSLSKLTAFIMVQDVFRIVVTTTYGRAELLADIQQAFMKAGVQGQPTMFILTDSQIVKDDFLIYINDILSAGYIPELFAKDELDGIISKVRAEAKGEGIEDAPGPIFNFFIDKVRRNLHMTLCFSPVGETFRVRARMFPGLINCTQSDWFHEWPEDALIGVANKFLEEITVLPDEELRNKIAEHMSFVHQSIHEANRQYRAQQRRNNYATPTSFLELIKFYKNLLEMKTSKINQQIERLSNGLNIMNRTTSQVADLQKLLEVKMVEVDHERAATGKLIEQVQAEKAEANREEEAANVQAAATKEVSDAAIQTKAIATKELEAAIPAMKAAEAAVNCLEVKAIQELKALQNPPPDCVVVTKAVLILKGQKSNHGWPQAQKMMNNPKQFLDYVKAYEGENIADWILKELEPILALDTFTFENMAKKSSAAANLCSWVINIVRYNTIYKNVKPLMESAEAAEKLANEKQEELRVVQEKVRVIVERVNALEAQLAEAEAKKKAVEDDANQLELNLSLANRLVNGLADENVRWTNNVKQFENEKLTMIGNALVSAAFVSYVGPYNATFRSDLWENQWLADIVQRTIPFTEGIDPLEVLSTDTDQAIWKTQGLPADRVSLENAAIVCSCQRYPLLIDPQLQGIKWIKGKEGAEMMNISLTQDKWLKKVEHALQSGMVLMIEGIGESIDSLLDPLLSKQFVKKGKNFQVKIGSEDIEIMSSFKLYLQTKLINPHYKPETAAQCTIINFIVTESGLEDQLLAAVVRVEKPDLEQTKEELVAKQNQFLVTLAQLESDLLKNLSEADPDTILTNIVLIESLETTKATSTEIQRQQIEAKETEKTINQMREIYRRVAAEGSTLYFLLIQLNFVNHMYQYSLESFTTFFFKAIDNTEQLEEEEQRVLALRFSIRMTIYRWVQRGLFVRHKQIFLTQLTFRLIQLGIIEGQEYDAQKMNFLIFCPQKKDVALPVSLKKWMPETVWFSIQKLIEIELFEQFANNIEVGAAKRFEDWYNELTPETEKLPLDWKKLEQMPFEKLLVVRALRPDRTTTALDNFIRRVMPSGSDFVDCDSTSNSKQILESAYSDSTTTTPIYFILSPGVNPVEDVEYLAKSKGFDTRKMLHTIALGQGQDKVANDKLDAGHKEGLWVMLQNVHLMPSYLHELEKKLTAFALEGSAQNFRLFLTSEPSDAIPIGLLEKSIKLTNEPPAGLKDNLKRSFSFFKKEDIEDRDPKIKTILFGLCYFHSVLCERRRFGSKGWNRNYPFSMGDLRDSSIVLQNYMEMNQASGKIPWDDLRYIFGEIMYGGHIVDDQDRIFANTFLDVLMNDQLLDEAEMFPFVEGKNISFKTPTPLSHEAYIKYIEQELPPETPLGYGLHPNAEIDYRTKQCEELFSILVDLQPKNATGAGASSEDAKVKDYFDLVNNSLSLETLKVNIEDVNSKLDEQTRGPYQNAFIQECEKLNVLIDGILRSLSDLDLAYKGELTMNEAMETLEDNIRLDRVPPQWKKIAYPSERGLISWTENIKARIDQMNLWKDDPAKIPKVVFINRLINPSSFLTAIKQVFCRQSNPQQELNKTTILTEVQKKMFWEQDLPELSAIQGALVFGFQVEGARWEPSSVSLEESFPKISFSIVPVVTCRAAIMTDKEDKAVYICPVYKTIDRMNTFVFQAQLRTRYPAAKWVIAGVAMVLDVPGAADIFQPGKDPNA